MSPQNICIYLEVSIFTLSFAGGQGCICSKQGGQPKLRLSEVTLWNNCIAGFDGK